MEYFIGAMTAVSLWVLLQRFAAQQYIKHIPVIAKHSQARTFDLIRSSVSIALDIQQNGIPMDTQATRFQDKQSMKVLVWEDSAYWIRDNAVYSASIVDGNIDHENAKIVDTMVLDSVQLEKLSIIVEMLTKGKADDRGSSGNS